MNIIVCIKQVVIPKLPVEINSESKSIDEGKVRFYLNPFDEIALEEALRMKEKAGEGSVTVISVGPERVESALRACLAMGADEAIHLWDGDFEGSDFYAIAKILGAAITGLPYDVILCGNQTADDESGPVGIYLAEILDSLQVSAVRKIKFSPVDRKLIVHRKIEKFTEVLEVQLPVLITIQSGNRPRYPTLPARLDSLRREIQRKNRADLGLPASAVGRPGSTTEIVSISRPKPRKKIEIAKESNLSPTQNLMAVMSGGVQAKKDENSNILDGPALESATKVVDYCNKILGNTP